MRKAIFALVGVVAVMSAQGALAKGHIAGAAVGVVVAPKHHKVAGAVVGGAVGHHMAKTKAKKQAAAVAPK